MVQVLSSPRKYIQGAGALKEAGKFIGSLGSHVMVIVDSAVHDIAEQRLIPSLNGLGYTLERFGGECSKAEINRLQNIASSSGANVIAGFGGGKTLDTAKAVAYYLQKPVAILPSIASTDAPCSALSVIYTESGEFEEYLLLPQNPDIVLMDTSLVVQAPARFLVAGMGDALATKFEAEASSKRQLTTMAGGRPSASALALADLCFKILFEYGETARLAVERKVITPAVELVVEANTFLSGIGFESGGLAAAHAIHNGFTALEETHHYYHGEKVAFSTIVQLVLENRPTEEIFEVIDFCRAVGLPTTLRELGIGSADPERLRQVARAATAPDETIHNMPFPVTEEAVLNAIIAADALGDI
ncbi:MAG TPA: glycerol dehydrogenase [Syntrophomonadaceae bacterium]|nr:glycerol dehydrogenase [Syntrophomonadaceae bacterium]HPU49377.1 glycerol dehydrogenase [Syntrophomonadaceae bacterium]